VAVGTALAALACSGLVQPVEHPATDGSAIVTVPASWDAMELNDEAVVELGNPFQEAYLVVIAERNDDLSSDLQTYSDRMRAFERESLLGVSEIGPTATTVDGLPAIEYVMTGTKDGRVRVELPPGWSAATGLSDVADLQARSTEGAAFLRVISEPAEDLTLSLATYGERSRAAMMSGWAAGTATDPVATEIGGHPAVTSILRGEYDGARGGGAHRAARRAPVPPDHGLDRPVAVGGAARGPVAVREHPRGGRAASVSP
jgi:hypothetical protein